MVAGFVLVSILGIGANPSPHAAIVSDSVDLIELNHLHDDLGRHTIDQVIFYDWSPDYRRYDVVAWRLIEGDIGKLPVRLPGSKLYSVRWYDREGRIQREVRSPLFRETWTQNDPERNNKRVHEEKYRSSLRRIPDRSTVR